MRIVYWHVVHIERIALDYRLTWRTECREAISHKGNITAIVWMDQKSLYVIQNAHLPTTTMVKRGNSHGSKSEVSCSTPVSESNRHRGGVDLIDQHKCYYSYNRKSERWWLHHFIHQLKFRMELTD